MTYEYLNRKMKSAKQAKSAQKNPAVSRVWLLDFDGVVLRHPKVLQRVSQRVVEYVQQNTGSYLSQADATRLNRELYGRYGHTHLGMKKLFRPHSTLADFNRFVYEPGFINGLYREFGKEASVAQDMGAWKSWLEAHECDDHGILEKVVIFTNSPSAWVEPWLASSPLCNTFDEILSSDHPLFNDPNKKTDGLLKPALELYERIEYYHESHQLLYFLDDSRLNLEPICQRPQWVPVWFDNDPQKSVEKCVRPYEYP
jgi:FMN phosphatase YigB (HAD superfamily)